MLAAPIHSRLYTLNSLFKVFSILLLLTFSASHISFASASTTRFYAHLNLLSPVGVSWDIGEDQDGQYSARFFPRATDPLALTLVYDEQGETRVNSAGASDLIIPIGLSMNSGFEVVYD